MKDVDDATLSPKGKGGRCPSTASTTVSVQSPPVAGVFSGAKIPALEWGCNKCNSTALCSGHSLPTLGGCRSW